MSETVESGQGAEGAPMPLADIFSRGRGAPAANDAGQASTATEAAAAPETGDTVDAGQQRDASGRFAAKEPAQTDAAPPAAESEPASVPIAALKDERAKRQQLEAELARLREQQAKQPPMPSPTEDPEGYARHVAEAAFNEKLNVSEMLVRKDHAPEAVDEAIALFRAEAEANPALGMKLRTELHPWDWMMKEAAKIKARKEIGDDPAAYRERVRQELMAEMQATKPAAPAETAQPTLPKSLATERSVGARTPDNYAGPPPMDSIVRFR